MYIQECRLSNENELESNIFPETTYYFRLNRNKQNCMSVGINTELNKSAEPAFDQYYRLTLALVFITARIQGSRFTRFFDGVSKQVTPDHFVNVFPFRIFAGATAGND